MAVLESTVRAGVAARTREEMRGTAFGLFDAVFGASRFVGSLLLGTPYELGVAWLVVAAVVLQQAAIPLLIMLNRQPKVV